jgi:hypothetical protein
MIASPETLAVDSRRSLETLEIVPSPAEEVRPATQTDQGPEAVDETLYLIGRPTLKQFLRFVKSQAVNPPDEQTLTGEWQAAQALIHTLEKEEAGLADHPAIDRMGPEYEPLLIEFLKDPLVRYGFNDVPTEVAFVDLDNLVVYQKHIDLTFVQQLQRKLGPAPDPAAIFRFCLPYDHPLPPVKWSRIHRDSFVFMSPSNDLRFLGTMSMQPDHIKDYPPPGALVGVVGLAVGFGSNFLNAVYVKDVQRLILNNGSHRAYTLRSMGFHRVPCIVQHVASSDELELVASSAVQDNPDHYLKHPRPSMLRDYFNPKLHKVMPVHRRLRQIIVRFEIDEAYIPAF